MLIKSNFFECNISDNIINDTINVLFNNIKKMLLNDKSMNLTNPVNFVKYITGDNIKSLTNAQLKTFLQFCSKKNISSYNKWARRCGSSTLLAIFMLYSTYIKNKNICIVTNTKYNEISLKDLIVKFYYNLLKNSGGTMLNFTEETKKVFENRLFINIHFINKNVNSEYFRGCNFDIVVIENIDNFNSNLKDIFETIYPIKCVNKNFQLLLFSNLKFNLPEETKKYCNMFELVENTVLVQGSNIWEMN